MLRLKHVKQGLHCRNKEIFGDLKSRIFGDENPALFHSALQIKHINKPLSSLLINGDIVDAVVVIQNMFLQYY